MSLTSQSQKSCLEPIFKHSSRKWKELSAEGKSVGINDPKLKVGYLGDLGTKSKIELKELISRQDKLLCNTDFVTKLHDDGQKLRGRREELQHALDKLDETRRDHSALLPDMTALEWQWRNSSHTRCESYDEVQPLDSDDDENPDPLHLLATHSMDAPPRVIGAFGSQANKQIQDDSDPSEAIREELRKLDLRDQLPEEDKHNTVDHIQNCKANEPNSSVQSFGSKVLVSLEKKNELNVKREVFKPFRPKKKQNLLDQTTLATGTQCKGADIYIELSKVKFDSTRSAAIPAFGVSVPPTFTSLHPINVTGPRARQSALWACESAATGPLTAGAGQSIQLIPLRDSVELERQANERLKELQFKRTVKGSNSACEGAASHRRSGFFAYRDMNAKDEFLDDEEDYFLVDHVMSKKIRDQDDSFDESSMSEE